MLFEIPESPKKLIELLSPVSDHRGGWDEGVPAGDGSCVPAAVSADLALSGFPSSYVPVVRGVGGRFLHSSAFLHALYGRVAEPFGHRNDAIEFASKVIGVPNRRFVFVLRPPFQLVGHFMNAATTASGNLLFVDARHRLLDGPALFHQFIDKIATRIVNSAPDEKVQQIISENSATHWPDMGGNLDTMRSSVARVASRRMVIHFVETTNAQVDFDRLYALETALAAFQKQDADVGLGVKTLGVLFPPNGSRERVTDLAILRTAPQGSRVSVQFSEEVREKFGAEQLLAMKIGPGWVYFTFPANADQRIGSVRRLEAMLATLGLIEDVGDVAIESWGSQRPRVPAQFVNNFSRSLPDGAPSGRDLFHDYT